MLWEKEFRLKKKLKIILILVILISLIGTTVDGFSQKNIVDSKVKAKEFNLSNYDSKVAFSSESDIMKISKQYDIDNPEIIDEIIYVPLEFEPEKNNSYNVNNRPFNLLKGEFYIKKIGSYEKKGSIIQSSEFRAPGGTMKIGKSLSRSHSFSVATGMSVSAETVQAELKVAYGFSVTGTDYVENTQKVVVKNGCKKEVRAYRNLMCYNYELWEKDLKFDDYYGKGTVHRPIGVIFTISKNIKL